ncbi:unnamed protein product, partial [Prorocentrum cordatum]
DAQDAPGAPARGLMAEERLLQARLRQKLQGLAGGRASRWHLDAGLRSRLQQAVAELGGQADRNGPEPSLPTLREQNTRILQLLADLEKAKELELPENRRLMENLSSEPEPEPEDDVNSTSALWSLSTGVATTTGEETSATTGVRTPGPGEEASAAEEQAAESTTGEEVTTAEAGKIEATSTTVSSLLAVPESSTTVPSASTTFVASTTVTTTLTSTSQTSTSETSTTSGTRTSVWSTTVSTATNLWWTVHSGTCIVEGRCVHSPDYPLAYPLGETCEFELNVNVLQSEESLEGLYVLKSKDFNVKQEVNLLSVNGITYTAINGPDGVLPTEPIVWDVPAISTPATPAPTAGGEWWSYVSGPCTASEGCVASPNYPLAYSNDHVCYIGLAASSAQIEVTTFDTEARTADFDYMILNGYSYSGSGALSDSQVVTATIVWTSDYCCAASGWQFCAAQAPTPAPTMAPTPAPTMACEDYSGPFRDALNNTCDYYNEFSALCGVYDTSNFSASAMCCSCQGDCADNPDWTYWQFNVGTANCEEVARNPSWCTDFGSSSNVVLQGCPVSCGICKSYKWSVCMEPIPMVSVCSDLEEGTANQDASGDTCDVYEDSAIICFEAVSLNDCPCTDGDHTGCDMPECVMTMEVGQMCEADADLPNGDPRSFEQNNCYGGLDIWRAVKCAAPPETYVHHARNCASSEGTPLEAGAGVMNIIKGLSVADCSALCDEFQSCVAFNYGVDHGLVDPWTTSIGDCQLMATSNHTGCPADYYNLDLYIKMSCHKLAGHSQCETGAFCSASGHCLSCEQCGCISGFDGTCGHCAPPSVGESCDMLAYHVSRAGPVTPWPSGFNVYGTEEEGAGGCACHLRW